MGDASDAGSKKRRRSTHDDGRDDEQPVKVKQEIPAQNTGAGAGMESKVEQ